MSFSMEHEDMLPNFGLHCDCNVIEMGGVTPTTIIRTDTPFQVQFDWETSGMLNYIMAGTWHLQVFMEKMGGEEFSFPSGIGKQDAAFVSQPYHYQASDPHHQINIPAGVVPTGVYRLVVTMTMTGPSGYQAPIALFGEGPLVQLYDVGP